MTELVLHNMSEYPIVVRRVLTMGERRAPRGLETFDLGFTSIRIQDITRGLPLRIGRNLLPAIGAVEAAQLIAGTAFPELVLKLAPRFDQYLETAVDGSHDRFFWGAYGERIKLQAYAQINKIIEDQDTRQAVVTLWDPWLDNIEGKKDYPCTIALQFFVRDDELHMNTIMRSNDVWLGLPYDVFQFTQLQMSMARAMGLKFGQYRHTALSLHLYERDVDAATQLWDDYTKSRYRDEFLMVKQPTGIGRDGDNFHTIMQRAFSLLEGTEPNDMTPSEEWYRGLLHPSS